MPRGLEPKPKTVNSHMYADMILEKVGPAVLGLFPEGDAIYQDDGATIHPAAISLDAVRETFQERLEPDIQASTMADVFPIETAGE